MVSEKGLIMKKKSTKYILILCAILLVVLWMNMSSGRADTIEEALETHALTDDLKQTSIIEYSDNYRLEIYLGGREKIEVVGLSHNLFGWKVTSSIASDLKVRNLLDEGLGSVLRTSDFVLGTYDGLQTYRVKANDQDGQNISLEDYGFTIWYVKDLEEQTLQLEFYDLNDLIYEYTLD